MSAVSLTLVTGNVGKVTQTRQYLSVPITHEALDLPEIQSLDAIEVVTAKAQSAFAALGKPVLVEDTTFTMPQYGRLPGTFIKFFLEDIGPEGLCRLADADPQRSAIGTVHYALAYKNPDGENCEVKIFTGSITGTVSQAPAGNNGFGWDSVFIPAGESEPWATFSDEKKDTFSIRAQALQKLEAWLAEHPITE